MHFKKGFVLLPILLVVLALVVVGGGIYDYIQFRQPVLPPIVLTQVATTTSSTANPSAQTTQTQNSQQPSATINQDSLHPPIGSYSVTGTASNTDSVIIALVHADYNGSQDFNSISNFVGQNSGTAGMESLSVENEKWSIPLFTLNPDLVVSVLVYDSTTHTLLTKGTLTISSTTPPNFAPTPSSGTQNFPSGFLVPTAASIPSGFELSRPYYTSSLYAFKYTSQDVNDSFNISEFLETADNNYEKTVAGLENPRLNARKLADFTYEGSPGVVFESNPYNNHDLDLEWHDGNRYLNIDTQDDASSTIHFSADMLIATLKTFVRQP